MVLRKIAAVMTVGALGLGLAGCGPRHTETDASDRGMTHTDHIGGKEIEAAVKDMVARISEMNGRGWPPHVAMDSYGKPQVVIDEIFNATSVHFDTDNLRSELENQITNAGVVSIAARDNRSEAAMAERERAEMGMTGQGQEMQTMGTEDRTGLILAGRIEDDVIEIDGVRQHDYWFNLSLTDTVKSKIIATTRTKMRRVRD
jgi:hypothetical protein